VEGSNEGLFVMCFPSIYLGRVRKNRKPQSELLIPNWDLNQGKLIFQELTVNTWTQKCLFQLCMLVCDVISAKIKEREKEK